MVEFGQSARIIADRRSSETRGSSPAGTPAGNRRTRWGVGARHHVVFGDADRKMPVGQWARKWRGSAGFAASAVGRVDGRRHQLDDVTLAHQWTFFVGWPWWLSRTDEPPSERMDSGGGFVWGICSGHRPVSRPCSCRARGRADRGRRRRHRACSTCRRAGRRPRYGTPALRAGGCSSGRRRSTR